MGKFTNDHTVKDKKARLRWYNNSNGQWYRTRFGNIIK